MTTDCAHEVCMEQVADTLGGCDAQPESVSEPTAKSQEPMQTAKP